MHRYREIVVAFSKNGFGYIVKELGLHELIPLPKRFVANRQKHSKTIGERIRSFLEELGPTFVKMGQFASTRPDLLPDDIIQELEKLQDEVSPYAYKEVQALIEQELGMPTKQIFRTFQKTPLGSASIGQVHYAILRSGEEVAVKVQRPHIEQTIKTDLEILRKLAVLAEFRLDWAARYQITEIVEEFANAIIAELDYQVEGRNAERIANQFVNDDHIRVPNVYRDYSSKKVLTMEYIEGTKLNKLENLTHQGYNKKMLAERVVKALFQQIFMEGFFHGDPHPGNVAALPGEVIVFMDFGMVGRLTSEMRANFASLVVAMMRDNTDGVIKAISRMGMIPDDVNMELLRTDVDQLRDKYYDIPLQQISIGDAVNDLFSVAQRHYIQIPANLTLLGKTLLTMESMVERLDPDISIMKIAEPFGRKLFKEQYHPKKLAESAFRQWSEYGEIIADIPKNIRELTSIVKRGKLPIEISMDKADLFIKKLNRISNRLSFSIVLLSFSIIMVGLIIGSALGGKSSILWNIPAIEIGFIVATLMFLWLLFSIFRSGRF
ncbi:AarF/ABC1/UbiB kinase family protein [Lentibacillus sp. N15]|uniref:ABC1 kinase family protein n=1 Tax=Lentibacillus songyuanensis TaxID=3136161 RepID=UPI0031BAF7E0